MGKSITGRQWYTQECNFPIKLDKRLPRLCNSNVFVNFKYLFYGYLLGFFSTNLFAISVVFFNWLLATDYLYIYQANLEQVCNVYTKCNFKKSFESMFDFGFYLCHHFCFAH